MEDKPLTEDVAASEIRREDKILLDGQILTVCLREIRNTTFPRDEDEKTITLWFLERTTPVSGLEGQRITKVIAN